MALDLLKSSTLFAEEVIEELFAVPVTTSVFLK